MKDISELKQCPECGESWVAEEIQESSRHHYGGETHFSHLIGIEDPEKYDGVSYWMCPFCKATWDRFTGELIDLKED